MKRINLGSRPDWKDKAEEVGFKFHTMHDEPYWDEETVYEFTLAQVENDIEDPSTELHSMCREAADAIVESEELMERLGIPHAHWDLVASSWKSGHPALYGRFDLIYDGKNPAKMIEYNADTPTSLFESASFQWSWFEDVKDRLPAGADQFNNIYDAIVARFNEIFDPGTDVHFTAFKDLIEDYSTVELLAYCARDAGLGAHFVDLNEIGITDAGQFTDAESRVIGALFKLYPWEDILRDDFSAYITNSHCNFLEPPWKAVISNKGVLPVLWQLFEGHPNLLPAFFADEFVKGSDAVSRAADAFTGGVVRKPIFSREGASITIERNGEIIETAGDRSYDAHPMIVQAYQPLPEFHGFHPIIGAWIIGDACVGMGLREDRSIITQNLSRFKPHYIAD